MPDKRGPSVQSVERTATILKSYSAGEPAGVGELSRRLGFAKSTIFRLLSTLEACGFIAQNPETGLYHLDVELIPLANSVFVYSELRRAARPHLRSLVKYWKRVCTLSLLPSETTKGA